MLDMFRQRGLSSFIYGAIIVGMALVFVLEFNQSAGKKKAALNTACAASVKGHCVDPKDFLAAYRVMIPPEEQGGVRRARQMGLRKVALDGLIERELLISEAERLGLTVTKDELDDSIYEGNLLLSLPADNPQLASQYRDGRFQGMFRDPKTKRFDMSAYKRALRNIGRSEIEFREEQGREMLAAKMRDLVRAPVRVSEIEALDSYVDQKSSATVESIAVKLTYAGRYGVVVNDADLAKWAADKDNDKQITDLVGTRKEGSTPKPNHIRHILVKVDKGATPEARGIALGKLSEAMARVKRGEAFADVARDVSQDPGSAAKGGDVGDDTKPFVLPFKNAADALKPGEITPKAIETQFGYHLIEKDDPAKAADVEAALKKDAARELYVKGKALEAAKDIANKIQAALKAGKSGDDAIKDATASLKKPAGAFVALAVQAEETDANKADAGAKDANKGDAGAGKDDAKKPVVAVELTPDNDPDRPKLDVSSSFNRGGDPIPGLSQETAQKVLAFAFSAKAGELYSEPLRTDEGFTVIRLKEQKVATKEEFEKERDTFTQTLLATKQAEALAIYIKRLRDAAKEEIKIDQSYLTDPGANKDGGAPSQDFDDEGP